MKFFLYLCVQLVSVSVFSQLRNPNEQVALMTQGDLSNVKWYNIQEAERLNKIQPRKILVDVYTDWCGWCKRMDKNTFNHPVIAKYLNTYYYPVKFDAEMTDSVIFLGKKYINAGQGNRATHQLAEAFLKGQMSYPSIAYFTEKWEYMGAMPGYKTPDQMEVILKFIATDKYKTEKLEDFEKTFVGEIKKPETTPAQ